jgi:lysyl-tRNA synthetase class 1
MFWADKIAKEIIKSGKYKPYWVDDMKTPSGRIHVGSLRGVIIHDLVYKALKDQGVKPTFTYVFEDQDPMDDIPSYLDIAAWKKYLGQPLFSIPSPDGKAKSYGHFFAEEFQTVFNKIGAYPEIIWTSDLYRTGQMNQGIKTALDNVVEIRKIYNETYKKQLPDTWYPFQVWCPKCKKQSTTKIVTWDGETVNFECRPDAVAWTKGCGYTGKISPLSKNGEYKGKLSWKVEWPVKWQVIGVTVEGAGKDHMSAGGSHDVAKLICDRVLKYPVPYPIPYEFFLIGGKKMSSSKGRGSSSKEVSEILPPYLLRFIFTRTDYNKAIDFDPDATMAIPDLFDEYDRAWQAHNQGNDENLARAFELAQITDVPDKNPDLFIPRFRDVVNFYQLPNVNLSQKFSEIKGKKLNNYEEKVLINRFTDAVNWVNNYAPEEYRYQISIKSLEEINLSDAQWNFLNELSLIWKNVKDPETLQSEIFRLIKVKNINPKEAFNALYTVLLDKSHGPRAGWLMKKFPTDIIVKRLTLNKKSRD